MFWRLTSQAWRWNVRRRRHFLRNNVRMAGCQPGAGCALTDPRNEGEMPSLFLFSHDIVHLEGYRIGLFALRRTHLDHRIRPAPSGGIMPTSHM